MRIKWLIIFLIGFLTDGFSQANSWIKYEQDYLKLRLVENGWYRVTAQELENVGFPTTQVAASRLRLFRRGNELAIRSVSNPDNTLNYLEFYGRKNDGSTDSELYLENAQAHDGYNLFADTAAYFLTWNNTQTGLRIGTNSDNSSSGLTALNYFVDHIDIIQSDVYHPGRRFGVDFSLQLSAYDLGEGWTGSFVSKGGFQDFDLTMDDPQFSGPNPQMDLSMIGGNSRNHVIEVLAGPNTGSLTNIGQLTFEGYTFLNSSIEIPWSNVGGSGELIVRLNVIGEPESADRVSFARVQLEYPRQTSIPASGDLTFDVESGGTDRAYYVISGSDPAGVEYFDVTNPYIPLKLPVSGSGPVDLVVPNAQTTRKVIAVQNTLAVPSIESYSFKEIDLTDKNYLILSHSTLHDGESSDPILDYANYRSGEEGGNFNVVATDIEDVYDQFNYGDPSPLAIVRLLEAGYPTLTHLFIVGKGYTPDQNYYRRRFTYSAFINQPVSIPTYGLPGSDSRFSLGLGENPEIPFINVGRLNALTPDQVSDYLGKVQESEALAYDALWRKNLVQLSGGQNSFELNTFSRYIDNYKELAEGDFLGGSVKNQGKQTSAVSEFISIADEVNDGLGMITLFGHSSSLVTDIEIGRPSVQSQDGTSYQNKGRYPIVLVNGCQAGEIFRDFQSFGEDWVLTAEKGSIAFIAHANLALASNLNTFTTLFYNVAFGDESTAGYSLGEVINEVNGRYFASKGSGDISQTQVYQTLVQGDPVVKVFGAVLPDFSVDPTEVFESSIDGGKVLAVQDSFLINVVVENFGRTTLDSLDISVVRILADGTTTSSTQVFPSVKYRDTLQIVVSNLDVLDPEGNNSFNITLDPESKIPELSKNNNQLTYSFFLTSGSTFNLLPADRALVQNGEVSLFWQPVNILEKERVYELELDVVADFSSSSKQEVEVTGQDVLSHIFNTSTFGSDTVVVFWRTRLKDSQNASDTLWSESSFTVLPAEAEGWGQFSIEQFADNELQDLSISSGSFLFPSTLYSIELETIGTENYSYEDLKVVFDNTDLLLTNSFADPECAPNTFNAVGIKRTTGQLFQPVVQSGADELNPIVCGRLPQVIYNLTETQILNEDWLGQLIDGMATGDYLLLFNIDSVAYSLWDQNVLDQLIRLGVDTDELEGLVDGQPLIILGEKDASSGSATVIKTDGTILPEKQKTIALETNVVSQPNTGYLTTGVIGPARQWNSFEIEVNEESSDYSNFLIYGITADGEKEILTTTSQSRSLVDLDVNGAEYPYLEATIVFADSTQFTPPSLQSIDVRFEKFPEGALFISEKDKQDIQEGVDINTTINFWNISERDFTDSIDFNYLLQNLEEDQQIITSTSSAPLLAGDTIQDVFQISSSGLAGNNFLRISVEPREGDAFSGNNKFLINPYAEVQPDDINPILDVTFDGRYIMNGDIVSSQPTILVKLQDENKFTFKVDTTGFQIALKSPGESESFERIPLEDPRIIWTPASEDQEFQVEFQPGQLDDGIHSLRVQGQDASGNQAGDQPYEIDFEIINESTITNFFPYPNPFSTQCRFVFTLTGSEIPDKVMIQIMTISGKLVKTITSDDLGPIHIGNNITQYAWDGRDDYGDLLANGVYLYRVTTRIAGESIERRNTVADKAFKHGFGKLYILR